MGFMPSKIKKDLICLFLPVYRWINCIAIENISLVVYNRAYKVVLKKIEHFEFVGIASLIANPKSTHKVD